MKLTTSQTELAAALAACQGVADKKSTNPILSHVRIDAESGTVSATALYLATTQQLGTFKCSKPGVAIVPARAMFDRVRVMPKGELTIESSESGDVTIKAKGTKRRFKLSGLAGDDFPSLPSYDGEWQTVNREEFADVIGSARHAISEDDTRLHLNSLLLASDDGKLVVAATDGHRLAVESVPSIEWEGDDLLVPLKGVNEILRAITNSEAECVSVGTAGPNLFVSVGQNRFAVKLVDGQFPPYQQVVPTESKGEHRINRLALIDAVKAVSVSVSQNTGGLRVTLGSDDVKLEAQSPESGEGADSVPCESNGPDILFGVSAKFLLDALQSFSGESVTVCVNGELDPILIHDGGGRKRVVMPLRV